MKQKQARASSSARSWVGLSSLIAAVTLPLQVLAAETSPLLVTETELQVQYGKYAEATIGLPNAGNRSVEWTILGANVPPGLSIYDTNGASLVLYGTPTFTGTWCTVYVGRAAASGGQSALEGMQEVCFNSAENPQVQYPRFTKDDRYFDEKRPGASFSETIAVTSARGIQSGETYEQFFPENSTSISYSGSQFQIRGTIATVGSYLFAVKVTDRQGAANHRQYALIVEDAQEVPACPAGHYFDSDLGYCVPANSENRCPDGTYYESGSNQCVQFPAPPPTVVCVPGYYFDPFLSRCVPSYAERCPLNYAYDVYEGRCVRQPYTCSYGEQYNYSVKDCVRVYRRTCSYNEHYDYYSDRCVRNYDACYRGFYYSSSFARCMPVNYRCSYDEVYDPRYGGCRSVYRPTNCSYGTTYDWSLNRCVSVYHHRPTYCSAGYRYDPFYRSCRAYNPTPTPRPRVIRPAPAVCPGGVYQPSTGRCSTTRVPRTRPNLPGPVRGSPTCPPGSVYDGSIGRCGSAGTPGRSPGRNVPPRTTPNRPSRPDRTTTPPSREAPPTRIPNPPTQGNPPPRTIPPSRPDRTTPPTQGNSPTRPDRTPTPPRREAPPHTTPNPPSRPDRTTAPPRREVPPHTTPTPPTRQAPSRTRTTTPPTRETSTRPPPSRPERTSTPSNRRPPARTTTPSSGGSSRPSTPPPPRSDRPRPPRN